MIHFGISFVIHQSNHLQLKIRNMALVRTSTSTRWSYLILQQMQLQKFPVLKSIMGLQVIGNTHYLFFCISSHYIQQANTLTIGRIQRRWISLGNEGRIHFNNAASVHIFYIFRKITSQKFVFSNYDIIKLSRLPIMGTIYIFLIIIYINQGS